MNAGHLRRMVFAVGMLLPVVVFATRMGPPSIKKCYNCSELFREISVMSGNNLGAIFATDGRAHLPMLPFAPQLVRCRKCQKPIWAPKCEVVGHDDFFAKVRKWKDVTEPENAREEDYLAFVAGLPAGDEREKQMRIRAWWTRRDPFFGQQQPALPWTAAQHRNVSRLIELLDDRVADDRLMHAEIERQLGNFETCLKLLDGDFPAEFSSRVRQMRELASAKRTTVEKLDR